MYCLFKVTILSQVIQIGSQVKFYPSELPFITLLSLCEAGRAGKHPGTGKPGLNVGIGWKKMC